MPDQPWQIGVQFQLNGNNGELGNHPAPGSGTIDADAGAFLGDPDTGEGSSGVATPTFTAQLREAVKVAGSFSVLPRVVERVTAEGFALSWLLRGSGKAQPATPDAATTQPYTAYKALLECAGLTQSQVGTTNEYRLSDNSIRYSSAYVWIGTKRISLLDLLIESLSVAYTPGGVPVATAQFRVGSHSILSSQAFPTFNHLTLTSTRPPIVESAGHAWGTVRGFTELAWSIETEVAEIPDSNQPGGQRLGVDSRTITIPHELFLDSADDAFSYNEIGLGGTNKPVAFRLGTATAAENDVALGHKVDVLFPQTTETQFGELSGFEMERPGIQAVVNPASPTAGTEFVLTFD